MTKTTDQEARANAQEPLINGQEMKTRDAIGFHCNGMEAWTEPRFKIVRTLKAKKNPNASWELYDLSIDPFEEKDLAKEKPENVTRMAKDFSVWAKSCTADEKKVIDKYHVPKAKKKKQQEN